MKSYYLIAIVFLFHSAFAQDRPVRFLDIGNGLSNNSVMTTCQDKDGFIWIGTISGLNRFDGYSFTAYQNRIGDKNSLITNTIYAICGDYKSNIWVGGIKGGCIFRQSSHNFQPLYYRFNNTKLPLEGTVHHINQMGNSMLVGTRSDGLLLFEKDSTCGTRIHFGTSKDKYSYNVSEITDKDVNGIRWVFVAGRGLCRFDERLRKLTLYYPSSLSVRSIETTLDGNLWLGTYNGLYYFDVKKKQASPNYFPRNTDVTDVLRDRSGRILVTTDGGEAGIYEVTGTQLKPYYPGGNADNMKSNVFYDIYEDTNGNKWFATLRGGVILEEYAPRDFKVVKYNKSNVRPVDDYIFSFCEDGNKLWIGTDGAGLRLWDRATNTYEVFSKSGTGNHHIPNDFIPSIIKDSRNNIWFATWGGGIGKIGPGRTSIKNYTLCNTAEHRAENSVWLVYEDRHKNLWACASNPGCLYLYNAAADAFELYDKNITNIQSITTGADGTLWAGINYYSLINIDIKKHTFTTYETGYAVRCVYQDSKKRIWAGTQDGGLLQFDPKTKKFKRLTVDNGLPSNTILGILEHNGYLWMSTFNGLCRFNPDKGTFRNFSADDGLQSNQFNFNASLRFSTGEFAFGGLNGFTLFNPAHITTSYPAHPVMLAGFRVGNQPFAWQENTANTKTVRLKYDQTTLSIDYLSLDYNNAERVSYAYQLAGWDDHWVLAGKNRTANYTKLPEGDYVFKVKSSNLVGGWNAPQKLIAITVLPPWYRSWWSYLIYAAALWGIVYAYLWYSRSRQQLKISKLERLKEKELAEKQLSLFTNISHEFRTPLSLIINPLKKAMHRSNSESQPVAEQLGVAYRNARRLLSLVDQLMLFRKAESDADVLKLSAINMVSLCNEVFYCFTNQAAEKGIDYTFNHPETVPDIIGDYEKIEIALFNLMSNAFKYTNAGGSITLSILESEQHISIEITDTGIGIPEDEQQHVFERYKRLGPASFNSGFGMGLFITKHFVEKHDGNISFKSTPGTGSTFCIAFLKDTAHFGAMPVRHNNPVTSGLISELKTEAAEPPAGYADIEHEAQGAHNPLLLSDKKTVLIVDDDSEIRDYLATLFVEDYMVYTAENGNLGFEIAARQVPELIITDITMDGLNGLELCKKIKEDKDLNHIPVILLTATANNETQVAGLGEGADDYITKPFDSDVLLAKAERLIKSRADLRNYFLNSITLKENSLKVPAEYQTFLQDCIAAIEQNIDKNTFSSKEFSHLMGMSYRMLYAKIKMISGQSMNAFIRSIRLRRAAYLMLTENNITIAQASTRVGLEDQKYFRKKFAELFGMTPSVYIKKYKGSFNKDLKIIKK